MKAYDNTMLSAYQHCPRYYYYRHILHLDVGVVSVAIELGSAIHKGCEVWHQEGDKGKAEKGFIDQWQDALDRGMIVGHSEIPFRSKDGGLMILGQYMDTNPQVRMGSELVGVEQHFEVVLENNNIVCYICNGKAIANNGIACNYCQGTGELGSRVHYHGRMDIVWDWKGFGYIVVDWKTHKGNWRPPPPAPNNQVTGYIYALGKYFERGSAARDTRSDFTSSTAKAK